MYLNIEEGVNVMKLFKKAVSVIVSGAAAFTLMGNTTVILSDAAFDNTAITAESTEKDTFELNGELDAERIYDGSAYIHGINKTGSTGEIIEVPVYLKLEEDLQPQSIIGIAFKIEYDHDALELVDIDEPDESAFSDGGLNTNITNGVYMYTYTIANITVDPQYPIVNLHFKVKAEQGTYNIHLANHLFKGKALQLIHTQNRESETTYLKTYTKDFSITAENKPTKTLGNETFELNGRLDAERTYDGSAFIWGADMTGFKGDTIEVPVYLKLDEDAQPQSITGIAFKVGYDHDALELTDIDEPDEAGFSDGALNASPQTGVFLYTYTTDSITVDPQYPIVNLYFKVKADSGTYKIHLNNHLYGDKAFHIIHTQYSASEATYLKPYTKDISITAEKKLGKITGVNVDSSGTVTWNNVENAVKYKAVRYYKGRYYYGTATKDTSYKFVYAPDTYYQAYVLAYDSKGRFVKSETVDVNTGIGTIGEPVVDSSGNVTWDKVKYATHYRVVRITDGKPVYSKTVKDTSYSFVHVPDTDYRVMVIAYAGDGSEAASPIVTVKKA
jgi:hypothetical protein